MKWWTEERIAELKRLRALGVSKKEIAETLGTTAFAVLHAAHRYKLPPSMCKGPQWSNERIAELLLLVAENKSAGQIAAIMSTTRNAIIGMRSRLGLSRTKTTRVMNRRTYFSTGLKPPPYVSPPDLATQPIDSALPLDLRSGASLAIFTLRREIECCWPLGDPSAEDFHFCCAASASGRTIAPATQH